MVKKKEFLFCEELRIDADGKTKFTPEFDADKFREFSLEVQIVLVGTPTDSTVEIQVQVKNSKTGQWHDKKDGAFGNMLWSQASIPTNDRGLAVSTHGKCAAQAMRLKIVGTLVTTLNAANYFKLKIAGSFVD